MGLLTFVYTFHYISVQCCHIGVSMQLEMLSQNILNAQNIKFKVLSMFLSFGIHFMPFQSLNLYRKQSYYITIMTILLCLSSKLWLLKSPNLITNNCMWIFKKRFSQMFMILHELSIMNAILHGLIITVDKHLWSYSRYM